MPPRNSRRSGRRRRADAPPSEDVLVRTYTAPDYPAVRDLWRGAGLTIGPSDRPRELERTRRRDPDLFLVAEWGGRLVGAVLGRFDGRRGWINHLAVRSTARHLGIGTRLMAEVERRLARKGCAKVNLHIFPENAAVCEFYGRIGYGRRPFIFMDKWLRGPRAARPPPRRGPRVGARS